MDDKQILKHLGDCIRTMRIEKGLSQRKLAEIAKTSEQYISAVEGGRHNLSFGILFRIMQVLEVPAHQLFYPQHMDDDETGALLLRQYASCTEQDKQVVADTVQVLVSSLKRKAIMEKADEDHKRTLKEVEGCQ